MPKRLGILTGGGDCPGLNAVIRAATKTAYSHGYEMFGFLDGYTGVVEGRYIKLDPPAISGLLHRGGTILGTNNRSNPFYFPVKENGEVTYRDMSDKAITRLEQMGIEVLLVVGGDGTLAGARDFKARGARVIGIPKTIDNDLAATDQTFGFDTAVRTATEALDKLHTTAESHHRVMVLELMGRYAGWIALYSGLAGGADVILIPEIPWHIESVLKKIEARRAEGKPFSIVVVAEGVKSPEGELVVQRTVEGSVERVRLGGIGQLVGKLIEEKSGIETRVTVLGHIQRGGSPSSYDRVLATRFGVAAAELAVKGIHGVMVCLRGNDISHVPLEAAVGKPRTIPLDHQLLATARAIGISFGDD
ncbi:MULTISPECIES: 6-phosphofructokinase [Neomoorella]|jgi:6-phosphofructokinase 1|uniref:6-phosphofructokinase n=1 Tax=Neomoorella TaxID=44260 RepID=UPI0010FFB879|nr:ATP-dependent 6-phosphofructokinase [Moorella sp. E308F]MDK2816452.1 ATP-dependent phosphofructokinase / diphosphate-dependent phosphofructokinase [Moorella sp. (in: firmicutes)]GEA16161.1 ATP-dependent 6-phosphofructokinase [Moorella sp. E308F]